MNTQVKDNKKKSNALKVSGVLLAIALVIKLLTAAFKDTIIVYSGIRTFTAISTVSTAFLVVAGIVFVLFLIIRVSSQAKERKAKMIQDVENDKGPDLRMKGDLDPERVRESLRSSSAEWANDPYVESACKAIYKNMDDMDGYQAKLKKLLDSNGADALRDTEEVLNKVEQHICRNVRKLINIMTVLDSGNANDRALILTTAKNCTDDNNKLLESTRNFMMAVSQFLNTQGEDGGTIQEIESYKKILTDQIQEGGIYR